MDNLIRFADPALGTSLSFPGLGLELSINREAIFIGPLTIYWYGIIFVVGIALGVCYAVWRAGQFGMDRDRVTDVILYSIIAGVVCARIYYVVFSWDYYKLHPEEIIAIWKGGIAFYGGVIGALLCAAVLCRRWKLPLLRGTDAALGGLLLGQSIGRWGNFINIEAFGGYFEGPWRMVSPAIDRYLHTNPELLPGFTPEQVLSMQNIPVHPTFFYESAWTMLGFIFLLWYTNRRKFTGELTLFYFFWNGVGRAVIEGLRTDSLTFGTIRVSQVLAAVMAVAAVILWIWARKKQQDGAAPPWMAVAPPLTMLQAAEALKDATETPTEAVEAPENATETPEEPIPQENSSSDEEKL